MRAADCVGYLEPERSIRIFAAEPGIVREVLVREGQQVQAGEVLVKMDAEVLALEAKMAQEEFEMQSRRLERLRGLLPQKFASEDELLRAESDHKITALRKQRIEAQIERLVLRSPIDGVVTELRFDVGEGIQGTSSHVATVAKLDPMQVQFNVPLRAAASLHLGQTVQVGFPDTAQTRDGIVEFISPVSIPIVNTVRVKISIPSPGDLPSGIKAILKIEE